MRQLGVRNIAQYSAGNVHRMPFPAVFFFFLPTFTSFILSAMFTGACGPPEKLSLALVQRSNVLRMTLKLAYLSQCEQNKVTKPGVALGSQRPWGLDGSFVVQPCSLLSKGGGLTENIPRVLPQGRGVVLDAASWEVPPVFGWLSAQGKISSAEMARTFNCGIGAAVVVEKSEADTVVQRLKESGQNAWIVGEVVHCESASNRVQIRHLAESLTLAASKTDVSDAVTVNGAVGGAAKRLKLHIRETVARERMKVGVLISGSGTNLQALIDQSLRHDSCAEIVLVISNKPGVQGLQRAENAGIPTKVVAVRSYAVLCRCWCLLCLLCCVCCVCAVSVSVCVVSVLCCAVLCLLCLCCTVML